MTDSEKVNLIDSIENTDNFTEEHFKTVLKYISDKDAFVRSRCVYILGEFILADFRTESVIRLLLEMCSDEDAFVRTEAYDSLSLFPDGRAESLLYKAILNEPDELARGYSVLAWSDIVYCLHEKYDDDIKFLLDILEREKSEMCLLDCWYGLYRFGYGQALSNMLNFLKSNDYCRRCAVLNLLSDIMKKEDKDIIIFAVEELLKIEKTTAVKSDAEKIMTLLSGM